MGFGTGRLLFFMQCFIYELYQLEIYFSIPRAGMVEGFAGVRNPKLGATHPDAGVRNPDAGGHDPDAGGRNPDVGGLLVYFTKPLY